MRKRPLLVVLIAVALLSLAAPTAAWSAPADQTRTEYIVEQLREDPVFISDHITRAFPPADRERVREILRGTGVPTYLMAMPLTEVDPRGQDLLAVVHDRLGADGLYISTDETGIFLEAQAWGHDLPTTAALHATTFELPYDAGPVLNLERFVEVLNDDDPAARAQAAVDADARGEEAPPIHGDPVDRRNLAFSAGAALSGLPILVLCTVLYVRSVRRRLRAAAAGGAR